MICVWILFMGPVHASAALQDAGSTNPVRTAIVTVITSAITIDGVLEERDWGAAPKIGALTQREPANGQAPTENTEVTLLRDADNLYIGVMCYDSEPDRIIGTQRARDVGLNTDDRLEIVLDTYRDQRNAFYFATNPVGALVDGLLFSNGQSNLNWDAIWQVRTRRTDEGWSAEFAIPFKSLSFPAGRGVWGFNIARHIQRKLEDDRWSGARLETPFFQVSEAGEIGNLEGITQGIGLDLRPFIGGRWLHANANGNDTVTGKPGLDLFYNFTSSLKLSATVNTDFGETEVDDRQINLSRFSLFFPEKRSFFLEDAGVFAFSNTAVAAPGFLAPTRFEVIPFFSRQIGLLAGREVPIDFGTKLTGKIGRTDIGVLDARTRDVPNVTAKNFFVGRVKRNLFEQSYIGGIVTSGNPGRPISSQTAGADLRLATSDFLDSKNLVFNAYGLKSRNQGISGRDMSYGFSVEYPNDLIEMELFWREVQQNFRPALGFVGRSNLRLLRIGGRYNPRPKDFLNLQQMFMGIFYNRFTRADTGQVESWALHIPAPIDWHFKSGDALHAVMWPTVTYERLFAPFQIYPGVILPPAEYRFTRWRLSAATAAKRRVQASGQWVLGTFWSGHADEVNLTLTFKIPPRFTISVSANQTFASMPQRNFVARVFSSQANYTASPYLSFSNLIQYDNVSRNLGWQSRARWILRPGNDVFFVFTQGWIQEQQGGYRFTPQESKVSAKIQYTFRY